MALSIAELEKLDVFQFESIEDGFVNANLFLGNGFSISLCDRLSYKSLFKKFTDNLGGKWGKAFESFGTANFELIIQILNNAELVNKIVKYETERIETLRDRLRTELINTIQQNHPAHAEIYYPQLRNLGLELIQFNDIFTTNYDVLLCGSLLQVISDFRDKGLEDPYQDYFYEEESPTQLSFNYLPVRSIPRSIYYLHGALFIYRFPNSSIAYKLRRLEHAQLEYIQLIRREIENNNFPIFVAEGDARDKQRAVNENSYLSFCSNQLYYSRSNLVVYGFSFGTSDYHIVDLITKSKIEDIAIGLYVGNKSSAEIIIERDFFVNRFQNKNVVVYDSNSLFHSLRPF
jgi:hypothetical protein